MVAIVKTNEKHNDSNLNQSSNYHIYVARKTNPNDNYVNWKKKYEIHWTEYKITETDYRIKTATVTTPNKFDLTTGVYCLLIVSTNHENFGGVILKSDYDDETGLYTYQCQDFSRNYLEVFEIINENKTMYKVLQTLLTANGININTAVTKKVKNNWKYTLSGLRPAWQYEQRPYGSTFNFNPMTQKNKMVIRGKNCIEAIRDLVIGSGAYIDVYVDQYGIVQFEPYHKDDFYNTGLHLVSQEISNADCTFDTSNIITGVKIENKDLNLGNKVYSKDILKLDLSAFFGNAETSITTSVETKTNTNTGSNKQATSSAKTNNPYGTKKKTVYLNTDSITGYNSDMQRMKDMAKILNQNGWSTKICGVGSESHYQQRGNVKNGIWFTLYGGACAGTLQETANSSWFRKPLVNNGSRTVVGFFPPTGDIRKGGKYYNFLPRAWDDGFSGSGYTGLKSPAKYLTNHAIPFMYAKNAKEMVAKFLAGGDNPSACNVDWRFYTKN